MSFKYFGNIKIAEFKFDLKKIKYFLRVLLSLVLVLIVYENLQYALVYVSSIDQDEALLYYDALFFGKIHPTKLIELFITNWLTDWFSFAYISFFFYLPILGIFYYTTDRAKDWSLLVLTLTITLFSGYALYLFFPAVGPGVYMFNQYTLYLDGSYITHFTREIVNTHGFARGTFPSLHIACSVIYIYFAYKSSKKLFYIFLPFIISLWISTVYLRHHYIIDLFAGLFLAIICIFLGQLILNKWHGTPQTKLD